MNRHRYGSRGTLCFARMGDRLPGELPGKGDRTVRRAAKATNPKYVAYGLFPGGSRHEWNAYAAHGLPVIPLWSGDRPMTLGGAQ